MLKINGYYNINIFYYIWSYLPVLLACLSSVIVFSAANINEIIVIYDRLYEVFIYLLLLSLILILIVHIITLWKVQFHTICNLIAIILWSAFNYAEIYTLANNYGLSKNLYIFIMWLFILALNTSIVYYISKKKYSTHLISIFIIGFFFLPLVQVSKYYYDYIITMEDETTYNLEQLPVNSVVYKPNVYFFIIDTYLRKDILQNIYNYNNDEFINNLNNRGFYIANKSIANFNQSATSITTTFETEYKFLKNIDNKDYAKNLGYSIINSPVLRIFNKNNYNVILVESLIPLAKCNQIVTHCIIGNNFYFSFLITTPIIQIANYIRYIFPTIEKYLDSIGLDKLLDTSIEKDDPRYIVEISFKFKQPYFIFAHLRITHSPFIYNEDCSRRDIKYDVYDKSQFKDIWTNNIDKLRSLYVSQIQCANKQMLEAVDKIIHKDRDAIIIIQSDHGWHTQNQKYIDISSWTKNQFLEYYGILNVLKLPESCKDILYPSISPVNTFRVEFSCIGFRKYELLPDRYFITIDNDNKYLIKDIYDIQPKLYEY